LSDIVAAVEGYGGPFLDGLDGGWILQERERLHCVFVRVSFQLMCIAALNGQYEQAIDLGRRILARDPLRESIQRNVMLLLVLNGQRAEAIRAYERLVVLMRSELSIEPMPETKCLHATIVSGGIFERLKELTDNYFAHPSDANSLRNL
jgi:DNA-binding SARP family transcriptional activator